MQKQLVFTATYNESDNISELIREINQYAPEADILIIDDNSPDGTGEILDEIAKKNVSLHIIHRRGKLGLGTAHTLAMKFALKENYDILITMDADFSHNPKYLPHIISNLKDNDFVIGSRYIEGGKCDYGFGRIFISRTANTLAKIFLGIKLKETTTSYRGFSRKALEAIPFDIIKSQGYSFFFESIYHISRHCSKLAEFPIHFEDRRAGQTKISKKEVINGVINLFKLFFRRILKKQHRASSNANQQIEELATCNVCHSSFHAELYPSTSSLHQSAKYNCTSAHHSSHGRIVKCLNCGLVFTNPQVRPDKILEMYSNVIDQTYMENADARVATFTYNLQNIIHLLPPRGRLLDVGSYYGIFLNIAKEYGYKVFGVEPSRDATKIAKDKYNIETLAPTLSQLPKNTEPFDIITAWDVLEHVSNPMSEIAECAKHLRPNGILAFSTLDISNWYPSILKEKWPWMMDMHIYYFDTEIIKYILKQNGFALIHHQAYCHIINFDYFLRKIASFGIPGANLLRKIVAPTPLANIKIPFRFGDIQLYVAKKL